MASAAKPVIGVLESGSEIRCIIEDTNSIILKGTVLGDGCVVGAGAVVCGKFEDKTEVGENNGFDRTEAL